MLTTTIYTTAIVISTSCGSLKLCISAIVISLFTCNQTSLYYCCCCMANTRGKSYLWCSFCNLAFLHGLFILAIIHWWWCLPALLNFVYLDLDGKNITCFFSVLRHNKHVFFIVELNYRLLCSSNRWFQFQLINHLSLCSTRVPWGYNSSRTTMTPSIASSRLEGGPMQGTKVHGARKRRTEAIRHRLHKPPLWAPLFAMIQPCSVSWVS